MARHRRRQLLWITVLLSLWLLLIGGPSSAEGDGQRRPLCQEDGICLPAPVAATEVLIQRVSPEPAAVPEPTCDTPLLVKRQSQVDPRAFQQLLQRRGYSRVEGLLTPQWWRVCLSDDRPGAQSAEIAALLALPEVAYAEPDGIATAALAPNDSYYGVQWALPKVGAPAAWDTTLGSTDVMIAVIDSGMDYYHPDSPQHLWLGVDLAGNDSDPYDDYGHGTHVTGIAAARTNNGVGVAGLCPGCSVLVVKVLTSAGTGSWSNVADGITYARTHYADTSEQLIVNLSLGARDSYSTVVADAIAATLAEGALVLAAAGNYGPAAPMFPASLPGVLAISATDILDLPSSPPTSIFVTHYGDFAAPGSSIYSTVPLWKRNPPYDYMSGTSMAAPHVAAAAGLVWSVHPEYSALQVRFALYETADVPTGWNPLYGVGRLNVAGAVSHPPIIIRHMYLPLIVH